MTDNIRYGLIAIVVLIMIALVSTNLRMGSENVSLEAELIQKQSQAVHYSLLKKRWDKKSVTAKLLNKLASIKPFYNQYPKGKNIFFSYEKLDAKLLDKLAYALFTSDAIIINYSIKKEGTVSSLSAEVKR